MVNDNAGSNIPTTETLANWANQYGLTHPVTADPTGTEAASYVTLGYPTYVLIDRDMSIINPDMYPVDENLIRATLSSGSDTGR